MSSTLTLNTNSLVKMRHSAHGQRPVSGHKQIRIERSKSAAPGIDIAGNESDLMLDIDSFDDENCSENKTSNNKFREATIFLTSAKRMSLGKIQNKRRSATPLAVEDLTEDELDSFYFDDSDNEEDYRYSKFDEKRHYESVCKEYDLLPSSTFLRQIDKPVCTLSNLMMTDKDIRPIAVSLVNNSKITEIDLSDNIFGDRGIYHIAEAFKENVFITRATLSRVGMDVSGMKCIQEGLKENKTLTYLDLSKNHLNAKSAIYVARMIQENDFIEELILRENDLDDEASRLMAKSIASNLTIRHLDLSWNHIRGRGASDLVKAICENVELLDVNLSFNGLGEEGCIMFGKFFQKNHTLRKLDISNTRINFLHLGNFLKGLRLNDTLEVLKITGNPITTDGAIAILKCLEKSSNSSLKDLHLEDTPINEEFLEAYAQLQRKKDIKVHHKEPNKKKISSIMREKKLEDYDPLMLLFEFMKQESFRLIDLFKTFDKNNDNVITKEELKDGFSRFSIQIPDAKIDALMDKLDVDKNQEVDFHELIYGRRRAAHVRHNANKDSTGKMAASLNKLKQLVEKSRRSKYETVDKNTNNKNLQKRHSLVTIEMPNEIKEAMMSVLDQTN